MGIFPLKPSLKNLMTIIERAFGLVLNGMRLLFGGFGSKQLDRCEVSLRFGGGFLKKGHYIRAAGIF